MLQINQLTSGYPGINVLNNIDLTVGNGDIVTVIGANGAGKTTLLRTLSATIPVTSGEIIFNGEKIAHRPSHIIVKKGLIHCPEGRELFPNLTVEANLMLGAYSIKSKREQKDNLEKVFTVFPRLKERILQKAGTLSGGEQQMCAIARGMMASPKLLLLDEPSLGLSPKLMDEMFTLIKKINKELNTTILLVEQDVTQSLEVAHYGYVLQTGKIVASGTTKELKNNEMIKKAYLGI